MTKPQAHQIVWSVLATILRAEVPNGSGWLEERQDGSRYSKRDRERLLAALDEIADELESRASRLSDEI